MNLSTLFGTYSPYLEFGWVTAPSTGPQSVATANGITALTLNTKIVDTGNNGDIGSGTGIVGPNTGLTVAGNQIGLKTGTYYYEAGAPIRSVAYQVDQAIMSLYNVTDSTYITRGSVQATTYGYTSTLQLKGQFTISSAKVFLMYLLVEGSVANWSGNQLVTPTNNSSIADQRTTIKLWKLA